VIITSDNPRSEKPAAIIGDIAAGAGPNHVTEADRSTAVFDALRAASPQDAVLIAGKGHERYQEINGERLPFDDVEVARSALNRILQDRRHA
jgi:UDP-N-acetylmuramoyl-L-alanyl-D-glutamate--2,6-diaminopimelate ligase